MAAHSTATVSVYANFAQPGPSGAYVDLLMANISGYGPFIIRHPLAP